MYSRPQICYTIPIMTTGTSEQNFDHLPEALRQKPEAAGVGQPPREAREQQLETKPEAGAAAGPAITEVKTADFFNVLKRKKPRPSAIPQVRDEITVRIEKILEDGIGDAYNRLSPVAKQEFKLKGEQTARKIRDLLRSSHVKIKKIFRLILEWLKMLPGINKFFLEQEAKIKTDRIITAHKRQTPS